MDPFAVKVTGLKQVPAIGNNLQLETVTRVTIMVGDHGAFTHDFPKGQDSPEAINAWKTMKQNEVKAIVGT